VYIKFNILKYGNIQAKTFVKLFLKKPTHIEI